jgi:hypothetical protein
MVYQGINVVKFRLSPHPRSKKMLSKRSQLLNNNNNNSNHQSNNNNSLLLNPNLNLNQQLSNSPLPLVDKV